MKRFSRLFRWLNLLLILVTFLAYLSPYINPETFSWLNIFGTAYPWFLLCNLLFVLFWIFVGNRYFLFSLGCIIMGWTHLTNFVGLNISSPQASEHSFNIATFNSSGLGFLANKDTSKHKRNIKDFVSSLDSKGKIDVLCLQEISALNAQNAIDKFRFPYEHRIKYRGTSIISRHPIIKTGEVEFTTKTNSCVWADIKLDNRIVRIYSLHLKSNQVSTETEKILKDGGMPEKETWSDIKGVFGKFRYTSKIRVQQARKVRAHMQDSPHPVILCGDFNETPQSYVYAMLSEGYCDSFREEGFGIGSTYAGRIPALRIDYILVAPQIKIEDCRILKQEYSDHYPVITRIQL